MQPQEYIGPMKVFGIQKEEFTTPAGGEVVRVLFESIPPKLMPMTAFKALSTTEPTDYTTLGEKKRALVINALVNLMMEYDMTALEAEVVLIELSKVISNMFDKAAHVAMTKAIYGKAQLDSWTPGTNFSHYRTMLECDSLVRREMQHVNDETQTTG